MATYVTKPVEPKTVTAVKLDPATGDITVNGTTVHAGNFLVIDANGTVWESDPTSFEAEYDPAPAPAAEPAPEAPAPAAEEAPVAAETLP